ncbi:hypothetical protein KY290_027657 [Solanum tuberosum]|uniref:Uncharacterized protein n=1 Tax=Solanum tuberosum TaxID=4113 RepID=A0ABQ7UFP2_SOLTU|nr:hypothetical protein KY290_027657 [Solanum tuberosum]
MEKLIMQFSKKYSRAMSCFLSTFWLSPGGVVKGQEQELTDLIMSSSQGTGAIHKNSMVLKLQYMNV